MIMRGILLLILLLSLTIWSELRAQNLSQIQFSAGFNVKEIDDF